MSNPWKRVPEPVVVQNLSDIMSEEIARGLQIKEDMKFAENVCEDQIITENEPITPHILQQIEDSQSSANRKVKEVCDSDAIIAKVLQCQFDKEHDEAIQRVERKKNGDAKVSVSLQNYRNTPSDLAYDSDSEVEEVDPSERKDWDRFETNEKEFARLPKRGFTVIEGERVTKHDSVINGRRNACRVMQFPPEFCTGDAAGFDMKLPNSVFNSLKAHSSWDQARRNKLLLDRKDSQATASLGIDEKTKLILFKLINNEMLEEIHGIISTGKESIVLHAYSNPAYSDKILPRECAIKIFKTTLNEFKTRDKYIEADYRFKDRYTKQNPRKFIPMWAEKEMHNIMRLQQIGINCPDIVCLKKHVLVMSYIGHDNQPAPKIKEIKLDTAEWSSVYNEVVDIMHKMYKIGHMIHADLSEYNILWHDKKCWIIDVSQSVEPDHPHGLEFLMRDCSTITKFFEKKGVPNTKSVADLFKSITGFEDIDVNLLQGVHSTSNNISSRFDIGPDDNRNESYPFEYVWEKTNENKAHASVRTRHKSGDSNKSENTEDDDDEDDFEQMWEHSKQQKLIIDDTANFGNELKLDNNDDAGRKTDPPELKEGIEKSSSGLVKI